MIDQSSAQVQIRIAQVQADDLVPLQLKKQHISVLKQSLVIQQGEDSSFKVITSIANTMIGSSIIVYPIMFIKDGIVGALLVLLAIGAALFFTCRLLLIHNREDEPQFSIQIKRILGKRWATLNSIVNITLLYIVSIVYFMLICGNFFDITSAIFVEISDDYKPPVSGQITLKKYSQQYASLIAILFTAPLIWRRDIDFLMKFFKFTIYLVFFYGFFVLVAFIRVLADSSLSFAKYQLFSPDFSTVAGAFALSLLLHPVGAPILKRNINQKNNMRDLFLGYCLTAVIYVYVGLVGALTCAPQVQQIYKPERANDYSTIFDCFRKNDDSSTGDIFFFVFGKIVQLGIFIQNLSVMPILSFLTRKEVINQFESQSAKRKAFVIYNVSMLLFCFVVTFFEVDVSIVISLNGAIVGFFMAYVIPIASHIVCLHGKLTQDQKAKRTELLLSTQSESDAQTIQQALKCNKHEHSSKLKHYLIYGGLMAMGFAVACFKLYAIFQ